jgi:hypothetical protein
VIDHHVAVRARRKPRRNRSGDRKSFARSRSRPTRPLTPNEIKGLHGDWVLRPPTGSEQPLATALLGARFAAAWLVCFVGLLLEI